jgi:hypothetical protein
MDDQTQQAADTKYTSNITPLLQNAKEIAGKGPNTFMTGNFDDAFNKEFFTLKDPRTYFSYSSAPSAALSSEGIVIIQDIISVV